MKKSAGTSEYEKTLRMLNPAQRKAVETIDGPVMVIAGPGTGKTHVLAARIARILEKTDTPPYAILALTFTESAAITMRERVVRMIGKSGHYVNIMTFHSFCSDIIKTHPEYFPIDRGSEPLSDLEKYEIFETLINSSKLRALKPLNMPMFYIKDIIQAISHLKREGIMPDDLKNIVHREFENLPDSASKTEEARFMKNKSKNEELLKVYEAYEKELRKRLRYDFDDMIAFVVEAFKNHELLLREYQEKLLYFLVDEYQDTNTSQNTVVEMLARYWGEQANLFVVGDPNQSIYRFQGASIENTLNFVHAFPSASIITLEEGYRSTTALYNAAHDVIVNNKLTGSESARELYTAVSHRLRSNVGKGTPVSVAVLPSQTLELVYIAEEIKQKLADGIAPEDIAVLYRNNADAIELQRVLEKWGIPYEIEGGENILEAEMIRQLLQFMYVIQDIKKSREDEKLFEIMSYEWTNIDPVLAMKIARSAGKARISIAEMIHKGHEFFMKHYDRDDITPIEFHEAEVFMKSLEDFITDDARQLFTEWFENVIKQSGYLNFILQQENKIELLTNVNSLFREIKSLVSEKKSMKLSGFLQAISTMQENRIHIFAEDLNVQRGVVHLSTVHKAKGREWTLVYLIHCIDGKWGNTRTREMIPLPQGILKNTDLSKKERNEDERRLFYVALTRAKKQFTITYPQTMIADYGSRDVTGSMFIEEIDTNHKNIIEPKSVSDRAQEHLETLLKKDEAPAITITDTDFFRDIVSDFRLSVTSLNTYLRDTDEFIENILLRVPRSKKPNMAFGTAVHSALEKFNKARLKGDVYEATHLLADFRATLESELLSPEDYEKWLEHGNSILPSYYNEYKAEDTNLLFVEKYFGYGMSRAVLGDVYLVGKIDRIDLLDKEKKTVRVVDYKTGKAKTVGEIEGTTRSANLSDRERSLPEGIRGSYKRQLLFYRLLTDLDQTFPYTASEGMLDFVEPHPQSRKHIRRTFEIMDTDIKDMKDLIRTVMKEIRNLDFMKKS